MHTPLSARLRAALAWTRETPFWAVSAFLHLLVLVFLMSLPAPRPEARAREIQPLVIKPAAPPLQPPPRPRAVKEQRVETLPMPTPPLEQPPMPLEIVEPEPPPLAGEPPRIGMLEDTARPPPRPPGGAPGEGPPIGGASTATESAVRAALEWLRRHQSADGGWRSRDFTANCTKTCENETPGHGDGRGFPEHDVGVTALAVLAFSGHGHTHRDGVNPEHVACVRRAVEYLKRAQIRSGDPETNGRFGAGDGEQWIYDHAIATLALAELLIMSNDHIGLGRSVHDAVRLCLRAQNDGFGWRYGIRPADNDTSVTGWMVLALKTAKNARLGIPKQEFSRAFAGAMNWFDRVTNSRGKTGYRIPGDEGSRLARDHPAPYPFSKSPSTMTAVALLGRLFSGENRDHPVVRAGVRLLMLETPRWQPRKGRSLSRINQYYWYYGSYALFQFGGKDWEAWNSDLRKTLVGNQRRAPGACEDGSWDPIGEWGPAGGRVYATALGAMTLEVYYRFVRSR